MTDERQYSPASERNRDPILAVLRQVLPREGLVLEIAAGTGMHAAWLSAHLPALRWQPTDPSEEALRSIAAWRAEGGPNLLPPIRLDVTEPWPIDRADAVFCANMIHIAPWEATLGLFAGAATILPPAILPPAILPPAILPPATLPTGAPIALYGPFIEPDVPTALSNLAFDASLRERDPRFGIRALVDVDAVAAAHGFRRTDRFEMPANNLLVVWRR
jgi:hypothetical protein